MSVKLERGIRGWLLKWSGLRSETPITDDELRELVGQAMVLLANSYIDNVRTCRNVANHGTTPSGCPWCGFDPIAE